MNESNSAAIGRLIPVNKWGDYAPWPPVGGLRHLIFHAKTNGFDRVIHRIGRRILIDEAAFYQWAAKVRKSNVSGGSKQ
jgi:hypothetical protein